MTIQFNAKLNNLKADKDVLVLTREIQMFCRVQLRKLQNAYPTNDNQHLGLRYLWLASRIVELVFWPFLVRPLRSVSQRTVYRQSDTRSQEY